MGFLSFLWKKPSSNNNTNDDLKAQSYDTTVAAAPPILGTYPVAGNGTNLLERFQQSHPRNNDVELDTSAPPPIVPRLRSDSVERPKSAPAHRVNDASLRARAAFYTRTSKGQGPPHKLPPKTWATEPPLPPSLVPAYIEESTASIKSSSTSSRGFVDLLDAQSAFKPLDFHGRVKATGAREFGEDVADRNAALNGPDLTSREAHNFYMKHFGAIPTGFIEHGYSRGPRKRHSVALGLRAEPLDSTSNHDIYMKKLPYVPEQLVGSDHGPGVLGPKGNRRNSLHSYVAYTSSMPRSPRRRHFHESDTHSSSHLRYHTVDDPDPEIAAEDSAQGVQRSRGASTHQSGRTLTLDSRHCRNGSERSSTSWEEEANPASPARHAPRRTMQPTSNTGLVIPASRSHNLQSPKSPNRLELVQEDRNSHEFTSLSVSKSIEGIRSNYLEPPSSLPTSPVDSNPRPKSRHGLNEIARRPRAQSIASTSSKDAKPTGIEIMIPDRNSSLRNYSMTSETETYSSLSSNPFRPQSRHTPSTSVDLTPILPSFPDLKPSQHTLSPEKGTPLRRRQSTQSASMESAASEPREHRPAPDLIVDAYESEDSFENPYKPRGECEKELLFAEGDYRSNGSQFPGLPGLSGMAARPTTSQSIQTRRLSAFHPPGGSDLAASDDEESYPDFMPSYPDQLPRDGYLSLPNRLSRPASNYMASPTRDEFVQDESSDDEISFDIPRRRPEAVRHQPPHRNLRHDAVEIPDIPPTQEQDTVDISTMMRLRRDAKAKRRESTSSSQRVRSTHRRSGIHMPVGERSGYASDVEP